MRIVTIGATHGTSLHQMLIRHGKICAHISVAAIAEFGLAFCKKGFGSFRFVNRMALRASYVVLGVLRSADVGAGETLLVTAQAGILHLPGVELRKSHNGRLTAMRFDVRFARTVAAFAARIGRRFLTGGNALEMRIPVEVEPDVRMARSAHRATRELVLGLFCCTGSAEEHNEQERGQEVPQDTHRLDDSDPDRRL
jgi:hypothetical protein